MIPQRGLLRAADRGGDLVDRGPDLQGGDLRPRRHRLRLPGLADGGHARPRGQGHALRAHRRHLLAGPGRGFKDIYNFGRKSWTSSSTSSGTTSALKIKTYLKTTNMTRLIRG